MTIAVDAKWEEMPPAHGGVYAIWNGIKCVYVGETCNLKDRFSDIAHCKHGFIKNRLALGITLEEIIKEHTISFVTDFIGRKELEEFLTVKWLGTIPGRLGCCDDIDEICEANRASCL